MRWDNLVEAITFAIIAICGGIVAHIRQFEEAKQEIPAAAHFWSIVRRAIMGGFGGLLVYFAWLGASWPEAYGFFTAGIVGLFASEAFEFAWSVVKRVVEKRAGIEHYGPPRPHTDLHSSSKYTRDQDRNRYHD